MLISHKLMECFLFHCYFTEQQRQSEFRTKVLLAIMRTNSKNSISIRGNSNSLCSPIFYAQNTSFIKYAMNEKRKMENSFRAIHKPNTFAPLRMHHFDVYMIVSNREFNCFQKVVYLYHLVDVIFIKIEWQMEHDTRSIHANSVLAHRHSRFLFQFSICNF